jgi:hypothetical protein
LRAEAPKTFTREEKVFQGDSAEPSSFVMIILGSSTHLTHARDTITENVILKKKSVSR